jgi:hypothetical protein
MIDMRRKIISRQEPPQCKGAQHVGWSNLARARDLPKLLLGCHRQPK